MQQKKASIDTLARRSARARPKRRARWSAVLALWVLSAAFVGTAVLLTVRLLAYRAAREEYVQVQAMVEATDEPGLPTQAALGGGDAASVSASPAGVTPKPFFSGKVAVLQKENRDAVAWLDIGGTGMQYPVVQGDDNAYYMTHTYKKRRNDSGAIFLDCWNAPEFTDFNTVIYGHNMKDGSMFSGLRDYASQKFAQKHAIVEVTLLHKKLRYEVFAAYTAQSEETADFRGQECASEQARSTFIKDAIRRSDITSERRVRRSDRLLTLVTCTSGSHPWYWVVHAVLVGEQTAAE